MGTLVLVIVILLRMQDDGELTPTRKLMMIATGLMIIRAVVQFQRGMVQ